MMSYITGIVTATKRQSIELLVGPIGFDLMVPDGSQFPVGTSKKVYISMHWNTEQGPSFYGFLTELEKAVFLLVTSCSGIGPRIGLAILAALGPEGVLQSIQEGNEKALSSVSGIGAKKAEQIIVHLKHKVASLIDSGISLEGAQSVTEWHTVTEALFALNYSRSEVNGALSYLRGIEASGQRNFDQL